MHGRTRALSGQRLAPSVPDPSPSHESLASGQSKPDAHCVSFTHDRDWESVKRTPRPEGSEKFANTAWCPPPHAEYDGFGGKGGRYRDRLTVDPIDLLD